jgi:hypothetical protein
MLPFLFANEAFWWAHRVWRRGEDYRAARSLADRLGLPLVVIGAPDLGATAGPGGGDLTIDLAVSSVPGSIQADICGGPGSIPLPDDSCVVYVSCVLEYVPDLESALLEISRVSGGRFFVTRVEPWTLAAHFYPGARRTL